MREDFFVRLFAYRERPNRAPIEDFLTEVFCEFLRCLSAADLGKLIQPLLGLNLIPAKSFVWETQQNIGDGRPDIIGRGRCNDRKDLFVIIENKVFAEFTIAGEPGTEIGQLDRYQRYLEKIQDTVNVQLILITHGSRPPIGYGEKPIYWSRIAKQISTWLQSGTLENQATLNWISKWLVNYLEKNNMAEIKLDIATIGAKSSWDKLSDACFSLGLEAKTMLSKELENKLQTCGFVWPKRSPSHDYTSYSIYQIPVNAKGRSVDESCVAIWAGVKLGNYWYVNNLHEDIPEFFVAISAWQPDTDNKKLPFSNVELIQEFQRKSTLPNSWVIQSDEDGDQRKIASVIKRETFTHKYGPDIDWVTTSKEFFREAYKDLMSIPDEALRELITWHGSVEKAQE